MGLFPGSVDADSPAVTYGPLPTHGRTAVAVVYHTTETNGVPGFRGGATAPHYLYHPDRARWVRYAEYEDGYVGTLKGHETGGHGNCKAFQVEIVGYSERDKAVERGGLWVGDFDDRNYSELGRFWDWARDRYGVADAFTPTPDGGWLAGTGSPYRMTDEQWRQFSGLTAHGAVPLNSHWDTGVLDLERIANEGDAHMWLDDWTDATWMVVFNETDVPGVNGNGRYYCQNDGTYDFTEDPDGPWDPSIQRPWGRDGQGHNHEELKNAINHVWQGFALALDRS